MPKLIIKPDEHVFIAGQTGTGKTQLGKKYLAGYENVVALDTKGTLTWPEVPSKDLALVTTINELDKVPQKKIIYRPSFEELTLEVYDQFFKWCYYRGNTIVWVDELMGVCPSPFKMPDYYKAILTRGRELYVSVWSMTQRPSGIPALAMSESSHIFTFLLNMPQDREKIAQASGCREFLIPPGKKRDYVFWYYNFDMDRPVRAKLVEKP